MKKRYQLTGIHCAGCVRTVEQALSQVEGVESANVNLASETATVEFKNGKNLDQQLQQAVVNAGYGLEIPIPDAADLKKKERERTS